MKKSSDKYPQLFLLLTEAVQGFIYEVDKHDLSDMASREWTVKDQLCHVAGWHDYYAQNYAAMANGTAPFLFASRGGSTRNQEMVEKLKHKSKSFLVAKFNNAHTSLQESIVMKKVPKMTYILGRDYTTEDFLQMITAHIQRHTLLVRRAKKLS